jgi:type I restriction enzyme S subunit
MAELKLPEGWAETNLESIISISSGVGLTKTKMIEGLIPVFGGNGITGWHNSPNVYEPTIVIGRVGFYCGSVHLTPKKAWVTDNAFITNFNSTFLDKAFLFKLLTATNLRDDDSSTAQPVISGRKVYPIRINFPPLAEQKVIADKLDTLLAQVETTKARLDRIPQILKTFRQSVLASAVSGTLTEAWNLKDKMQKWNSVMLDELINESANGLSKRSGDQGKPVTILRLADFKDASRAYGKERQINLSEKELEKYCLLNGDILIIRVNGSVELAGRFIEYSSDGVPEGFCDHFIRLRLNTKKVLPTYLCFVANEGVGRIYLQGSLSTSAGQNTINQGSVKGLNVPLPSLDEQTEIVRHVEKLFAHAEKIEQQVKAAQQRVNKLTQSILAKAFRGELTTQWRKDNPALITGDNSAEALLTKIKAEREAHASKKKQPKREKRKPYENF